MIQSQDLFGNPVTSEIESSATFSPCRTYRYALWRKWGSGPYAMFIGLNPSTADELTNDPTIRRCIAFARGWGYDALCMANLFGYRATKPIDMKKASDPVGPENDNILSRLASDAGIAIAAWGTNGTYKGRDQSVKQLVPNLHYLRMTKGGHPSHPLYLPANLLPVEWLRNA
jgi:hypothetical protein